MGPPLWLHKVAVGLRVPHRREGQSQIGDHAHCPEDGQQQGLRDRITQADTPKQNIAFPEEAQQGWNSAEAKTPCLE